MAILLGTIFHVLIHWNLVKPIFRQTHGTMVDVGDQRHELSGHFQYWLVSSK